MTLSHFSQSITKIFFVLLLALLPHLFIAQTKTIDSLQQKLLSLPNDIQRIQTLCALSKELGSIEPAISIDYARQALHLADSLHSNQGMATSLQRLAISYRMRALYDQALECGFQSLRLAEGSSDTLSMYHSLMEISTVYSSMQDFRAARRMNLRASSLSRIDSNAQSQFLNSTGVSYFWLKNYDSALYYFRSAEEMNIRIGDSLKLGVNKGNIAWSLCRQGRYKEALRPAYEALEFAERNNLNRNIAQASIVLAEILDGQGEFQRAESYAQKSLQLTERVGLPEMCLWSLERLSFIAEHRGKTVDALRYQRLFVTKKDSLQQKNQSDRSSILFSRYEEESREREVSKLQIQLLQKSTNEQILWRNSLIGGVIFTLALLALAINRYYSKQRSEALLRQNQTELEQQATEIQLANTQLQQSYETVTVLSTIGQRITATLDLERVLNLVYDSVNQLMDATIFGIGIYNNRDEVIEYRLALERGVRYPVYTRDMKDKNQFPVWCIEHKKPVIVNDLEKDSARYIMNLSKLQIINDVLVDGTKPQNPQSLLYLPLTVENRVLGIITVQSYSKNAYTPYHVDILGTLASYAAIAVDNAANYRELDETLKRLRTAQTQLAQAEKMASLGTLVAGVAHELNTPIGVAVTAASTLHVRTHDFAKRYTEGGLKKSELETYILTAKTGADLTLRNLERAANLIQSFKQVSVDQTYDNIRRFGVKQYLHEIITSLQPKWKTTGHRVEIECDEALEMETYAGAIAQIITNFVTNSLLHGFEGYTEEGVMKIEAERVGSNVVIQYSDNGRGIPPEILPRIFDPFFTTKQANGGTGLGMHIVYNLVTQKLGGEIHWSSEQGVGTTFQIELPMQHHNQKVKQT